MTSSFVRSVVLICSVGALVTGCSTAQSTQGNTGNAPANQAVGPGQSNVNTAAPHGSAFQVNQVKTSQWLKVNAAKHTVQIQLSTPVDNLSLNGYSNGYAEIAVPENWKITVQYTNNNQVVREGLAVVQHTQMSKGPQAALAFPGAATPDYKNGIAPGGKKEFTFVPNQTGKYVLETVQTGQSGTWIWLSVNPSNTTPAVKTH